MESEFASYNLHILPNKTRCSIDIRMFRIICVSVILSVALFYSGAYFAGLTLDSIEVKNILSSSNLSEEIRSLKAENERLRKEVKAYGEERKEAGYPCPLYMMPTRNLTAPLCSPIPNPRLDLCDTSPPDPRCFEIHSRLRNITLPPNASTNWIHYRFGDMFFSHKHRNSRLGWQLHSTLFPQSLAVEYMERIDDRHNGSDHDYNTMMLILRERLERNETLQRMLPDNNTLVIHLRTGDVIDSDVLEIREFLSFNNASSKRRSPGYWYTRSLPFYAEIWDQIQAEHIEIDKILVITGWHFEIPHFRSIAYINEIIRYLEQLVDTVVIRINENPDEDVLIMSQSKYFVESGGGFSRMIGQFVERFHGTVYGKQINSRLSTRSLCYFSQYFGSKANLLSSHV